MTRWLSGERGDPVGVHSVGESLEYHLDLEEIGRGGGGERSGRRRRRPLRPFLQQRCDGGGGGPVRLPYLLPEEVDGAPYDADDLPRPAAEDRLPLSPGSGFESNRMPEESRTAWPDMARAHPILLRGVGGLRVLARQVAQS